jgi:hypothetical protein
MKRKLVSEIQISVIKKSEDNYHLVCNLGMTIFSTMNQQDFEFMLNALKHMKEKGNVNEVYYFPSTIEIEE